MRDDLLRYGLMLAAALLCGWLFGYPFLWLSLCLAYLLYKLHADLQLYLRWMKNPKDIDPPDATGLLDQIYRANEVRRKRNKSRKKQLRNYLKQFKKATAALPDATVILSEDNEIAWSNKPARKILGIRWPQDAGHRIDNLIRNPTLGHIIDSDKQSEQTVEIPSPTNPDIFLTIQIVPYGKSQRLFIARDITEITRANRMRSDFVANVSHELRTPLTIIHGYTETLQDCEKAAALRPQLQIMQQQTQRMQAIVNDLLMLSRLEQEENAPIREPVAVAEMLGKIHREAMKLGEDKKHLFYLEADPELLLQGNPSELYSCFSNLVLNAVKYTADNGVIRIVWYRDEKGAHMLVKDTGKGIPAIHLPRLTERFYRVDRGRARSEGGTGLGLAIVKHVLNRHQAELHVESVLGKGSSFRCDFPVDLIAANHDKSGLNQQG